MKRAEIPSWQRLSVEQMRNSLGVHRFVELILWLAVLIGGLVGVVMFIRVCLLGRFEWGFVVILLIALCMVFFGGLMVSRYFRRFWEKPMIIRGVVLNKIIETERTIEDDGGVHESSPERFIQVGRDKFHLKEKVYERLTIGDQVTLTYFPSIDEVTWVKKAVSKR